MRLILRVDGERYIVFRERHVNKKGKKIYKKGKQPIIFHWLRDEEKKSWREKYMGKQHTGNENGNSTIVVEAIRRVYEGDGNRKGEGTNWVVHGGQTNEGKKGRKNTREEERDK